MHDACFLNYIFVCLFQLEQQHAKILERIIVILRIVLVCQWNRTFSLPVELTMDARAIFFFFVHTLLPFRSCSFLKNRLKKNRIPFFSTVIVNHPDATTGPVPRDVVLLAHAPMQLHLGSARWFRLAWIIIKGHGLIGVHHLAPYTQRKEKESQRYRSMYNPKR